MSRDFAASETLNVGAPVFCYADGPSGRMRDDVLLIEHMDRVSVELNIAEKAEVQALIAFEGKSVIPESDFYALLGGRARARIFMPGSQSSTHKQ